MKESMPLMAGQLITISSGEYNDYTVHGVFVVAKDFSPDEIKAIYLAANPDQKTPYGFSVWEFVSWLELHDYVKSLDCGDLRISDFGNGEILVR